MAASTPMSTLSSTCPQHVLNFILEGKLRDCYRLEHIEDAKSAQQEVYILRIRAADVVATAPDVYEVSSHGPPRKGLNPPPDWLDALDSGRNHLVVRIWKGGSQWWNLHRNSSPLALAKSEVMFYQIARDAFSITNCKRVVEGEVQGEYIQPAQHTVVIPQILHFEPESSLRSPPASASESGPWAVLEYVGPKSRYFNGGGDHKAGYDDEVFVEDTSYLDGMIKVRTEYGFEEPHPRWGRVPVEHALDYSQIILRQVVLPLHRQSRLLWKRITQHGCQDPVVVDISLTQVQTYSAMLQLYRYAWKDMMIAASVQQLNKHDAHDQAGDPRMIHALQFLEGALLVLGSIRHPSADGDTCIDADGDKNVSIPPLPPVLVHMDLQPQNLIFRRSKPRRQFRDDYNSDSQWRESKQHQSENRSPMVFSVLDFEDAAWADPRFEVLLLCRKVCANRNQADKLWMEYGAAVTFGDGSDNASDLLGPIEPWLQLEIVHSITTLLLQSMDLLNGGRKPWETKRDLWGKLEREFARWEGT